MLFKLIIVEDEKIMREGFANFVDWKSLNFEVAAKFEDGRDAIDYIAKNHVDAILTDIKMTFVSGIELAKFIFENELPIKVVLVSGFKEFEYARQAISYNVNHFLLKPAPIQEIEKVFKDIKQQLEKEIQIRLIQNEKDEKYEEVVKLLQEQLFADIALGIARDEDEIRKTIYLLGLKIDVEHSKCCIVNIKTGDFPVNSRNYREGRIYTTICDSLHSNAGIISFNSIGKKQGDLKFLAILQGSAGMDFFENETNRILEIVKQSIKNFLSMDIIFSIERSFESIMEFASDSALRANREDNAIDCDNNLKVSKANVIDCVKEYIGDRYNSNLTLDDIAEHVFLNPIYLSRLFKEQTGENYIDYLVKVRIEKAIKLLKDNRYKVYEVGNMVGYDSIKYFYKVFKRVTGQTPTEFRESLRGDGL